MTARAPFAGVVRRARPAELRLLPGIENRADEVYRRVGLALVLAMPPAPVEEHRRGRTWVACDAHGRPVGFALTAVRRGAYWLQQLSVLPRHGGRGVGTALIEAACADARASGWPEIVLSTYLGVAWNAPFYARRGFEVVPLGAYGAALRRDRLETTALGHPPWRRCIMVRRIGPMRAD